MRLAVFSAFPQELRGIVRNIKVGKSPEKSPLKIISGSYSSSEILLVQTGMGGGNAEAAFHPVVEEYRPDVIASVGFGGALYNGASIGELVWASKVLSYDGTGIDAIEVPGAAEIAGRLSDRVEMHGGCVITLGRRMKKSEVQRILPRGLPFAVCDMETFPLARLAIGSGLPFLGVRSVTDRAGEDIPEELYDVCDEDGNYRLSRALGSLLRKPGLIPEAIKLGRASRLASENLWHVVKALIEAL